MNSEGEINRLKELPEDYDYELFNHYYKGMTPLIRKLAKNIDHRRFNVSKDIVISYFYDKLLYVFRKYYHLSTENPEKFKATIISSLQLFKSRLLINAYSQQSVDFNANLASFEDCFESAKEDLPEISEEERYKREKIEEIHDYMRTHVSTDAYLLFQIQMSPPPFFFSKNKKEPELTCSTLLDFFELPKTRCYIKYITQLKAEIKSAIDSMKSEISEI